MKNLVFLLFVALFFSCSRPKSVSLQSPDENIRLRFEANDSSSIFYSVDYKGDIVIRESQLSIQFSEEDLLGKNFKIVSTEKISVDTAWVPVYEEKSENRNHSNQLKVHMRETSSAGRKFEIVANSGLAIHFREK